MGTLNFYSGASYNLAQGSGGSLTLNNGSSAAQINVEYGNHTISAPVFAGVECDDRGGTDE